MMTADNGVVTEWQSYLGNLAMVEGRRAGEVLDRLRGVPLPRRQPAAGRRSSSPAIGAAKVLTRTPVRSVDVTDGGVRVALASGKMLEADRVILTAPPSTWNRIAIDPALPPGVGAADGHQREVPDGPQRPVLAARGARARSAQRRPGEHDVARAPKGRTAQARRWSASPAARRRKICRDWGARRAENYLAELGKVYKGIRGSYSGKSRFMDWPGDAWSKASYSFPAPGQVTAQGPTLYDGIGRLHFAGEYSSYAFMGFMEGALQLGRGGGETDRGQGRRGEGSRGVKLTGALALGLCDAGRLLGVPAPVDRFGRQRVEPDGSPHRRAARSAGGRGSRARASRPRS